MSSDDDSGLVLNLEVGTASSKKKRAKVTKNRKKRIERRRKVKVQKMKQKQADYLRNKNTTDESKNNQSTENGTTNAKEEDRIPTKVAVNKPKTELTSNAPPKQAKNKNQKVVPIQKTSIWGGNPEIPSIPIVEAPVHKIKAKTEEVLTSSQFSDLTSVDENLKCYITDKMGFKDMTSIQQRSLPHILNGDDVMMRSPTGSGKTLAYSLSIIQMLQARADNVTRLTGVTSLVLVPTRELAQQTLEVFLRICLPVRRIVPTCLMGGQKRKSEKARLRKGVNIIISTPGRLLDHMENTKCLKFDKITHVVLDEADRLLDLGFQPKIEKILKKIQEEKQEEEKSFQTILLSATLTKGVEKLIDLSLKDPVRIEVDDHEESSTENSKITTIDPKTNLRIDKVSFPTKLQQYVAVVPSKLRLVSLVSLIEFRCIGQKIVTFLSCRDSVEFHHQLLTKVVSDVMDWEEFVILPLHGGMEQKERSATMDKLKQSTSTTILLCTDVAARGLDIPQVDWVVQYTSPGNPVDYIHRVGRTARAGKQGKSLLFLTPAESEYVKILAEFEIEVNELKCDDLLKGLSEVTKSSPLQIQLSREKAAEIHNKMEEKVKSNKELKELSTKAFMSFVKSYATYPSSLKYIFHIKNLHLGHVAKSFALQEAPSQMLNSLKKCLGDNHIKSLKRKMTEKKREKMDHDNLAPTSKTLKHDPMSEFSMGVDFKKKRKV